MKGYKKEGLREVLLGEQGGAAAAAAMATVQIMGAQGKKIKGTTALQSSDPRVKKRAKSMLQRLKDKFAKKKKEKGFEKQKKSVAKGASAYLAKLDKESVNEGPWPVKGKVAGGVNQEAKLLEKAFKSAGVKVYKVREYGPRGANYFVDVQAKGGKTTISIEVNQVSNVVFMHSQGRDLKLGELKENPRELIKVLKMLKNQPGFGQSRLAKKESVNEAGGVVTARIQQNQKDIGRYLIQEVNHNLKVIKNL